MTWIHCVAEKDATGELKALYDAWFAEIAKKGGDGKRLLQDARELLEKNRR